MAKGAVKKETAPKETTKDVAVVSTPSTTTRRASIPAYKRIMNKMKVAGTITPFEESMVSRPKTWLESEMLNLNWVLGHGIPFGCLWEVSGTESSSKSSMVYALAGSLQKTHNALVMIYDTERLDNGMAVRTGLVPEMTAIATPDAKASIPNIVNDMMEKILLIEEDNEKGSYDADGPAPIIMIWDSIAATPTQTIKQAMANKREGVKVGIVTEQMSATAAQLTTALKTLHPAIVNNNILAIFINQMRDTISTVPTWGGPTEHTSGGRALKHASNIRLKTRYENMHKTFNESGKKDITEGNQHVGITFTIEAIKNKLAAPFKKTEFVNMFGTGIDIVQSNLLHAMYDLMEAQIVPLPVGGYFRVTAGGSEKKYRYGQMLDYYRSDPIAYGELCEKIKQAQAEMDQAMSPDEVSDLQRQAAALEAQEDAVVSGIDDFPVGESYDEEE